MLTDDEEIEEVDEESKESLKDKLSSNPFGMILVASIITSAIGFGALYSFYLLGLDMGLGTYFLLYISIAVGIYGGLCLIFLLSCILVPNILASQIIEPLDSAGYFEQIKNHNPGAIYINQSL